MYICKYCGKEFEYPYQIGGHISHCKLNPKYQENCLNTIKSVQKYYQNHIRKSNKKEFIFNCKKCGKKYSLLLTDNEYDKEKYSKFCCRSCANTRILTTETKNKISEGLVCYHNTNKEINNRLSNKIKIKSKKYWKKIFREHKIPFRCKNYCGSIENDFNHPEIVKHELKWFYNLIPFGLDINKLYTSDFINEFYKCKELLRKEYYDNEMSINDIYVKYNCKLYIKSIERLVQIFKDIVGELRKIGDAVSLAFQKGKLNEHINENCKNSKQQWHETWDGKKVFLRSTYELDYAIQLDNKKILYEVEFLRIKYFNNNIHKFRCAIPDFYIPSENLIVEIKSSYTLDINEMKDKFKEYQKLGYKTKLILDKQEVDINNL